MNSEQRRQKIIDAAIVVLQEKGVAASRMNDFVAASGLSKGGVYHHFDSKEQLLMGVLDSFLHSTLERISLEIDHSLSATTQLQNLLKDQHEIYSALGQYSPLFLDFSAQAPFLPHVRKHMRKHYLLFHTLLAELLELGIEQQEFKADTDAQAIASGLHGIFDGIGMASAWQ